MPPMGGWPIWRDAISAIRPTPRGRRVRGSERRGEFPTLTVAAHALQLIHRCGRRLPTSGNGEKALQITYHGGNVTFDRQPYAGRAGFGRNVMTAAVADSSAYVRGLEMPVFGGIVQTGYQFRDGSMP